MKLGLPASLVWLGWRAFSLFRRPLCPACDVDMPTADETLRNIGFGNMADAGQRFDSQIDSATGQESGSKNP